MTTLIIDADGRLHERSFAALRRKLGCALAGSQLVDFAVHERGCMMLRFRRAGVVQIRFRPSGVALIALLTAIEWLESSDVDKVELHCAPDAGHGGQPRFVANRPRAQIYLAGLVTAAQSVRQRDFGARRYSRSEVAADAAFARVQHAWRASGGRITDGLMHTLRAASRGRYLEVEPREGAAKLVIGVVGDGYSLYGSGWKAVAVGGRFEDMPDYEYAQWAALGYRDVFQHREPIFEDIVAAVHLLRSGWLLLTYRRVILPVGPGDHPRLLLGATLNQKVAPLTLEPVDKFGDVSQ